MPIVKMTAKRQVTFPAEICEDLGVESGDLIELKQIEVKGEPMWALQPAATSERPSWFGSLRKKARKVEDHSLEAIRESIAKGRGKSDG